MDKMITALEAKSDADLLALYDNRYECHLFLKYEMEIDPFSENNRALFLKLLNQEIVKRFRRTTEYLEQFQKALEDNLEHAKHHANDQAKYGYGELHKNITYAKWSAREAAYSTVLNSIRYHRGKDSRKNPST